MSMVGGCWRDNVGEERRWATSSIIRTRQVVPSGVHSRHVLGPRDWQFVFLYGMEGKI
jgi:hypothetical protein